MKYLLGYILICILLTGCTNLTPKPVPTPTPPLALHLLPYDACAKQDVVLWEQPGLPKVDYSSAYSNRGNELGALHKQPVQILHLTWSETDQIYWAYVRTEDFSRWFYHATDVPAGWAAFNFFTVGDCPPAE